MPIAGERRGTLQGGKANRACHFLGLTPVQMMDRGAGETSKITEVCIPKTKKCHRHGEKLVMMGDPFLSQLKAHHPNRTDVLEEGQCC